MEPSRGKILAHPRRQKRVEQLFEDGLQGYALACQAAHRAVDETLLQLAALEGHAREDRVSAIRAECHAILDTLRKFESYARSLSAADLPDGAEIARMAERVRTLRLALSKAT